MTVRMVCGKNLGCHIGDLFMDAIGYADDIVIIALAV